MRAMCSKGMRGVVAGGRQVVVTGTERGSSTGAGVVEEVLRRRGVVEVGGEGMVHGLLPCQGSPLQWGMHLVLWVSRGSSQRMMTFEV
jgi:hypothetical protein